MIINWNRWIKRDRGTLLFAGYAACIAAIILMTIKISRPNVKSVDDLYFINAPVSDYKFIDGKRGYHSYEISLRGYSNTFKINADFLNLFNKEKFTNSPSRDNLTISIAKEDLNKLNKGNEYLFIFSLANANEIYLKPTETVKKYNNTNDYYYFSSLILLGIILLYFGYNSKINTSIV
jgi:hypothetical protein